MGSTVVYNIFFMLGGIAILMFGMKMMGSNLEQVAGNNLKRMLGKVTTNRFAGVGIGAGVTAIVNSSTATTVMIVGFVNVGLLSLSQATSVIMGANIGTTITTLIMALSGGGDFDVAAIASLIAALGLFLTMFSKDEKITKIGNIIMGIGLIFIGLKIMSVSVDFIVWADKTNKVFRYDFIKNILQGEVFPLLLILIGIVLTALVHSSAAITGILIALGSAINFQTAVFIILGSNIGTCITSLVSSLGTSTNARRTAIIHLLFNIAGCLIFIVPVWIFADQFAEFMNSILGNSMEWQIALFHTFFNILTTAILLPFINPLVKLATKLIPEKDSVQSEKHKLTYIDDRLLETPPIAMDNTKKEIIKMAGIAKENINLAIDMLLSGDFSTQELQKDNEEAINFLNRSITQFLTKIMGKQLNSLDEKKLGTYYHVVIDVERVGDYAENIMEYAMKLKDEETLFSEDAMNELVQVKGTINELFDYSIKAFNERNVSYLDKVDELEETIDQFAVDLEKKHVERVKRGSCTAQLGSVYLQTISNLERVGDHITNLAFSILQYVKR